MSESLEIEAVDALGATRLVALTLKEPLDTDSTCLLSACVDSQWRFEASGESWLDALNKVRELAEAEGLKLLCAGARRNAVVSRMSVSMGRGRKAYLVQYGQQSSPDTLTDIFSPISVEDYSSVREQREFRDRWYEYFRSL